MERLSVGVAEDGFFPDWHAVFDAFEVFAGDVKSGLAVSGLHSDQDGGITRCDKTNAVVDGCEVLGIFLLHAGDDFVQFAARHVQVAGVVDAGDDFIILFTAHHAMETDVGTVFGRGEEGFFHLGDGFFGNRNFKITACHFLKLGSVLCGLMWRKIVPT